MANTIGWGKGTQNNTNGWGKYQNTIDAGSVYADSYAGETVLVGASAAFSYSASSFHQGEADPTPTITGTTGGTFSATPSGLSINTSTGTIDLDNSTIQSYTITYTVSGVSADQTLAVTASPFIANDFSMNFNGVDNYIDLGTSIDLGLNNTISMWLNFDVDYNSVLLGEGSYAFDYLIYAKRSNPYNSGISYVFYRIGSTAIEFPNIETYLTPSVWHNLIFVRTGDTVKSYVNGTLTDTITGFGTSTNTKFDTIGAKPAGSSFNLYMDGKMDEIAAWNAALSSDAVQEIYNATANNTGKVLDLNTDSGNYTNSSSLQYWNRMGD